MAKEKGRTKIDWQVVAGTIATAYLLGWLAFVMLSESHDRGMQEVNREVERVKERFHPKRVSYEDWRPVMHYWTDSGDRNYSQVMGEANRRKAYENLRHPWKARIRHYGELALGLGYLVAVIGSAAWAGMEAEEWIGKKLGKW